MLCYLLISEIVNFREAWIILGREKDSLMRHWLSSPTPAPHEAIIVAGSMILSAPQNRTNVGPQAGLPEHGPLPSPTLHPPEGGFVDGPRHTPGTITPSCQFISLKYQLLQNRGVASLSPPVPSCARPAPAALSSVPAGLASLDWPRGIA